MALSLLVLLVPLLLIVWLYRALYGGDSVVTVDPSETIASASRAGLTELPPATAPEGWYIVNAQFRDGTLRIGYLDAERRGVQLVQGRGELPRPVNDTDQAFRGSEGDMTVMLVTRDADVRPLAALLPIPVDGGNPS